MWQIDGENDCVLTWGDLMNITGAIQHLINRITKAILILADALSAQKRVYTHTQSGLISIESKAPSSELEALQNSRTGLSLGGYCIQFKCLLTIAGPNGYFFWLC